MSESKTERSKPDYAEVVIMPPLLYALALLVGVLAQWIFGGSLNAAGSWRWLVGGVSLVLGLIGAIRFQQIFTSIQQDKSPRTPTESIVTTGLYAVSRNPAYVSLTLILLGIAFVASSPWILATVPIVLAVMHWGVIRREEDYLERKFGEPYLEYKARVRRWL